MFRRRVIVLLLLSVNAFGNSFAQSKTFYCPGTIKPNYLSQQRLDKQVLDFYNKWKSRFVKNVAGKAEKYIWFENKGGKQCVSEGQGYGMMIVALMAARDADARSIFDDLFRYARSHPSRRSKYLMAWAQKTDNTDIDKTSATDGDLDMAYALLLADKQWGRSGTINYLEQAKNTINAAMQYEINHKTWSVLLSDAVEYDSKDYYATRSSDFMPSHFKAFATVTNDGRWLQVVNAGYKLFEGVQHQYSPDAGLIPDFMINLNTRPRPAKPYFLESKYDGDYNYNACRVPWRIGVDYLINGDLRAKHIDDKINTWIRQTTNNNTYNLSAGYSLAGNDLPSRYFEALSFVAPFAVSAMVDGKNQEWLNDIWRYLTGFKLKDYDYYDNSIKLLDMIIISGKYPAL